MYSAKQLTFLALVLAQLLGAIQCGVYDYTDNWVVSDKSKNFPDNAVLGGYDPYGYDNFVGRSIYSSSIVPARVVAETGTATYNTDKYANMATTYDLLVSNETLSYDWVRSFDGFREQHAVSVGTSATNDRIYVCRARTDGGLFIGSLYLDQHSCFIIFENTSVRQITKYEVLVRHTKPAQWSACDAHINN